MWSGRTPTEEKRDRKTDNSSWSNSTFFCNLSFSLARIFTLSSVSRVRIFAFSLDFLTATLFLSRRRRYSSEHLSPVEPFFLFDKYFGVAAKDFKDGRGPPRLNGRTGDIWSDGWGVELDTALL